MVPLSARRLPPYGRELQACLRGDLSRWPGTSPDGHYATVWVAAGPEAWLWGREHVARLLVLVAPPGSDPAACDWRLLRGHDPVLIHRAGTASDSEVHALAAALIRDGVERVLDVETGAMHIAERAAA